MSVNSSSSSYDCMSFGVGAFILLSYSVTKSFLLLPLSTLVLFLGHRRWRRRRRSVSTTSHSDVLTFHTAALELLSTFGNIVSMFGRYHEALQTVGNYLSFLVFPGLLCFHLLTCAERYVAVVHPVTYLGLRQSGGVKIRNISLVCVWLLCFGWCGMIYSAEFFFLLPCACLLVLCLIGVSFCSLRVLCVLIRPGPGEVGGDRERVDQSKQRALYTIMAIVGVLGFSLAGILAVIALGSSELLSSDNQCAVITSVSWFSLPSSLVLPLLFLHKAGKLPN